LIIEDDNYVFQIGDTDDKDIFELMQGAGSVVRVSIISDKISGRSKGFGFVEFKDSESANNAIKIYNTYLFNGRELYVQKVYKILNN